jgi:Zn-dependent oligopeptidase
MAGTTTTPAPNRLTKMTGLLKQMGASEEMTKQFGELLESYVAEQKTIVETKYTEKLNAAKALCLEETTRFKTQLAKRVQIFFEARAEKIETQMAKQVAIRESSAEADLKNIKALLEGVQVNAKGEVDLKAIQKQLGLLTKKASVLKEERDLAVTKANRANQIAQKALARNRLLEEAAKKTAPTIAEGKRTPAATATPTPKQIPVRKTGGQSQTPTTVMTEGVQAGRPQPKPPTQQPTGSMAAWDPNNVAANMAE